MDNFFYYKVSNFDLSCTSVRIRLRLSGDRLSVSRRLSLPQIKLFHSRDGNFRINSHSLTLETRNGSRVEIFLSF